MVGIWYAHGYIPFGLRIAEKFCNIIFTSTEKGFRLKSKKINIVGQGIDTNIFKPKENKNSDENDREQTVITTVGRISVSKDYMTMIDAVSKITTPVVLRIIGGPVIPADEIYLEELKKVIKEKGLEDNIVFVGTLPNREILSELQGSDMFVNTGMTGSLDKVVLEAMAAGVPVLSSNDSVVEVLEHDKRLVFEGKDSDKLATLIEGLIDGGGVKRREIGDRLREVVVKDHSLDKLIGKIIKFYNI